MNSSMLVGVWVIVCVCVCRKCEYCNVVVIDGSLDRVRSPTNVSIMKRLGSIFQSDEKRSFGIAGSSPRKRH